MSAKHRRMLRGVNLIRRMIREAWNHPNMDAGDDDPLNGEPIPRCPTCSKEWDGCGIPLETCDMCGFETGPCCMVDGMDDLYPTICYACAGADEVEAMNGGGRG